ncbi:MAG: DUF302 domain-containing protein [Acidobacteriia bacterium]|nr:DUF302 domain-containing protein [Terriglobia bacterium]
MVRNGETIENRREIAAPFETALKVIRSALFHEDLRISREFDVADIARGQPGMNLAPCRILCVDSPLLLLEAMALDPSAAVFLPLHIVISADGPSTQVYWLNPASIQSKRLPAGAMLPLRAVQARIVKAMEKISLNEENRLEMSR